MFCAQFREGQGAQRMVDVVAAGATPAVQINGGDTFLALLGETFERLAEAHAAELRRVQLGGELPTSSLDDDTAVPEALAVAAPVMEDAGPHPRDLRETGCSPPEPVLVSASMPVPARCAPSMEAPWQRPPLIPHRPNPCMGAVPSASMGDDKPASDTGRGGKDTPSLTNARSEGPRCESNSTPEGSEVVVLEDLSNSLLAPDAPTTLSRKAMGSSAKLDAIEVLDAPTTLSRKAMGSSVKLHAIEVTIFSAGDLRDADMMLGTGTSDPYCVCKIRGKPDSRFQTRVINDNCHPVWNYHRVVEDFEEGDVLEFVVFDRDMPPKEDDLLGSVDMESHMHFPQGFDGVLDLTVPKHFRCHDRSTLVVKVVPRDLLVEPEDDRAKADLQLLLDAGVKLWPELFPGYGIKLKPQGFVSTNSSLSRSASMEMYRERSTGTVHGTIITGHGRLERAIVMNPHGSFQGVWDLLSLACIFFDIFHVPFVLAFENETTRMKVANGITTGFWALDLLRSCFCGYYHDGIVEMRLSRIMTRYLKSWFLVDFVLVVMDIVGLLVDTAGPSTKFIPKMMRLLYVMRFVRVLSVIRIAKVVVRIERVTDGMRAEAIRAVIWLGTCMFIMLVGCHLLACGFYRLGHLTSNHGIPGWVLRENVDAQGWMYSYTTSVHWALTQFMPASSGINPGNAYERGYVLVVDVLGFVCFSFFVSNVQMQLQGLKKMSADSHQRNAQLRRFFTDHSISLALSQSIRCYINREDSQARNRRLRESEVQVLTKLPKGLQVQLRFEMYRAAVRSHPFFMGLMDIDMICFRRLCHGAMTEMALGCGEEVFVRGNKAHSMYFISGGRLLYKRPGLSFDINVGDWACEPVLWFPSWTHRGNLHTVGPADLVQVCAATFAALVFAPQASTVRRSYVQIYAAAFVRGGQSPTQLLHHSDLWGSAAAIDELVMQCMHQATSVNENRLADLWRETLAKESERL